MKSTQSVRPWLEVAEELTRAEDTETMLKLSRELDEALKVKQREKDHTHSAA